MHLHRQAEQKAWNLREGVLGFETAVLTFCSD